MATLRVDGSLEIGCVFATAMMDEAVYLKIFITNTPFVFILPSVVYLMSLGSHHGHVARRRT